MAYKSFAIHKNLCVDIDGTMFYTGATYGFINSVISLKKNYLNKNGKIYIAWDKGHETRTSIYPEYKLKRKDNRDPEEYKKFIKQVKFLKSIIPYVGVTQVYKKGCEADDIVGTLSRIKSKNNETVLLFSSDHDFYQLITEEVELFSHKWKNNQKIYNIKKFEKEFNITPDKYYHTMCLTGCKGDEVPGIRGIGEKTAIKILNNNPTIVKDIINDRFNVTDFEGSKNLLDKITEGVNIIKQASKLVKIFTDLEGMNYVKPYKDINKTEDILESLEFYSFLRENSWKEIKDLINN